MLRMLQMEKVKPEEIDEHVFDNYLDTAGILIRSDDPHKR